MTNSTASLRHSIASAGDLQSVVRTMKFVAAASIGQYEQSLRGLVDYYATVEQGLSACFRLIAMEPLVTGPIANERDERIGAIVFGSDQGLVGQFNEGLATFVQQTLSTLQGEPIVWAVGERVHARLAESGLAMLGLFAVPSSVAAISELVGQIQIASETHRTSAGYLRVYVFHNQPLPSRLYEPTVKRLLPLDAQWRQSLEKTAWPSGKLPEVIGGEPGTLKSLVREYLFISLFRACAESLASENASRLLAMQRADKNIDEWLEDMRMTLRRVRQGSIDAELFDVLAGFEALAGS